MADGELDPEKLKVLFKIFVEFLNPESLKDKELNESVQELCGFLRIPGVSLEKYEMCVRCKENKFRVKLECGHVYCERCLKQIVCEQTNGYVVLSKIEKKLQPFCVKCRSKISLKTYKELFGNIKDYEKMCKKRFLDQKPRIRCKACKFYYDNCEFSVLRCKDICNYCAYFRLKFSYSRCPRCTVEMENLENPVFTCCGCNSVKNLVSNTALNICDKHLLCNSCLVVSWKMSMCVACGVPLAKTDSLKKVCKHLFKKCFYCKCKYECEFIIPKVCCLANVCFSCQTKSREMDMCMNCLDQLPESTISTLSLVSSTAFYLD